MTAARVRRQQPPITYRDPQHLAALAPARTAMRRPVAACPPSSAWSRRPT